MFRYTFKTVSMGFITYSEKNTNKLLKRNCPRINITNPLAV